MKDIILTIVEIVTGDLILAFIILFLNNKNNKKNEIKLENKINELKKIIKENK